MATDDHDLTRAEWYAALLDTQGASHNTTAAWLGVRTSTVERLLDAARAKLGTRSRSELRRVISV